MHLFTCCSRAASVGGIPSIDRPLFAKNLFLSILTSEHVLVQSYSSTTNLSIVLIVCVEISFDADARQTKASVTSGKVFQIAHVFFPHPAIVETVSQPVIAWSTGSGLDFSGPRHARSLCAAM